MKNLILTVAVLVVSFLSFSQLNGMDDYKQIKRLPKKYKPNQKMSYDLFGERIYMFVSDNDGDHVSELVRIADANSIPLDQLDINMFYDPLMADFDTFLSKDGLLVTHVYVDLN